MKNVKRVRQENLAKVFDALGHYRRINIFTHILSYGETGISFGGTWRVSKPNPVNTIAPCLKNAQRRDYQQKTSWNHDDTYGKYFHFTNKHRQFNRRLN